MDWKRGNTMYYQTSSEGYTVAKAWSENRWKYFVTAPNGERLPGFYASGEEAKEVAEAHSDSQ